MIHALHGNLGSANDWSTIELPDLLVHDLWGILESDPDLTLESWGEGFSQAVSMNDPEPIVLGYSMGGRLALHAMVAAPEQWKGAIILSAHPGLNDESERKIRFNRDREWANQVRSSHWQKFLETWNAQPVLAGAPPSPAQFQLEHHREEIARAFENWSLGRQEPLGERLAACQFPILWITGERDEKFSSLAAGLGEVVPDFEHAVLPDCGHRIPFECPLELSAKIRDFLERCS